MPRWTLRRARRRTQPPSIPHPMPSPRQRCWPSTRWAWAAWRCAARPTARDAWLNLLRRLLPKGSPWRRVPLNPGDAALIGGLDFAATLQCGRPVAQNGVLAQADGGFALLAMAERTSAHTAARIAAVMDAREVALQRDGIAQRHNARVALVLLDEGCDDDEQAPPALLDRVAFRIPIDAMRSCVELAQWPGLDGDRIAQLRGQLNTVSADDACLRSLCAVALALGVDSMRAPLLALRAARRGGAGRTRYRHPG